MLTMVRNWERVHPATQELTSGFSHQNLFQEVKHTIDYLKHS